MFWQNFPHIMRNHVDTKNCACGTIEVFLQLWRSGVGHAKTSMRFWYLKISQNWDCALAGLMEISVTHSIYEIKGSYLECSLFFCINNFLFYNLSSLTNFSMASFFIPPSLKGNWKVKKNALDPRVTLRCQFLFWPSFIIRENHISILR